MWVTQCGFFTSKSYSLYAIICYQTQASDDNRLCLKEVGLRGKNSHCASWFSNG
jgi:hypothetical protein